MYESKLFRIMEAYKKMDEFPKLFHEQLEITNIDWDEDDMEENPELKDVTSETIEIDYEQQYEGDHSGRDEEISKHFRDAYGYEPLDTYGIEVLDGYAIDESVEGDVDGTDVDEVPPHVAEFKAAISSVDSESMLDLVFALLSAISCLDPESYSKVRNELSADEDVDGTLKNAVVKLMDSMPND